MEYPTEHCPVSREVSCRRKPHRGQNVSRVWVCASRAAELTASRIEQHSRDLRLWSCSIIAGPGSAAIRPTGAVGISWVRHMTHASQLRGRRVPSRPSNVKRPPVAPAQNEDHPGLGAGAGGIEGDGSERGPEPQATGVQVPSELRQAVPRMACGRPSMYTLCV